jgi:Tfp pilus assembly protein PilZ
VTQDREHPRYAHEATVTLHVAGKAMAGHTQNMSRGGLCAQLSEPIAVGSAIDVDIVLMFEDDAQSEALRLPARVVWCTVVDDAHQIGLSFRALDAEQAEFLGLMLRFLDDGGRREKRPGYVTIDKRFD